MKVGSKPTGTKNSRRGGTVIPFIGPQATAEVPRVIIGEGWEVLVQEKQLRKGVWKKISDPFWYSASGASTVLAAALLGKSIGDYAITRHPTRKNQQPEHCWEILDVQQPAQPGLLTQIETVSFARLF